MKLLFNNTKSNDKLIYLKDDKIQKELCKKLNETKMLIDDYYMDWNKIKKYIHNHEYVYASKYNSISNVNPISRSYFKLIEMYYDYDILDKCKENKIVCLAEAPGGFIQSILNLLDYNKIINIYGNSLKSEIKSIPKWNNKLMNYKKISFYNGINNNGDLYDLMNVISLIKEYGKESIDFITGDGGFDYSSDYSKQEINSYKLIYSEIFIALNIQKKGGNFICKIFDIFYKETILLISILINAYSEVYIHKPLTSRDSNSEKYIICKKYKGYNSKLINYMCHNFGNKLNIPITKNILDDIMNFNTMYCINQINKIEKGINLIKNKQINNKPTKDQIELSYKWCIKYNVKINKKNKYLKYYNFPVDQE